MKYQTLSQYKSQGNYIVKGPTTDIHERENYENKFGEQLSLQAGRQSMRFHLYNDKNLDGK